MLVNSPHSPLVNILSIGKISMFQWCFSVLVYGMICYIFCYLTITQINMDLVVSDGHNRINFSEPLKNATTSSKCYCMSRSVLKTLRLSYTYMCQQLTTSFIQIMACSMFGSDPLSEPMLEYYQFTLGDKLQWNFNRNLKIFIHENTFENVCKIVSILSRPQCVTVKPSSTEARILQV